MSFQAATANGTAPSAAAAGTVMNNTDSKPPTTPSKTQAATLPEMKVAAPSVTPLGVNVTSYSAEENAAKSTSGNEVCPLQSDILQ